MLRKAITAVVYKSASRPWLVLSLSVVVAAVSLLYVVNNFAINTDISKLISPNLPWRQQEIAIGDAFPKQGSTILAVIDAPTPEMAQDASNRLTQRLSQPSEVIRGARQLNGSEFFRKNGLLFLSEQELTETLTQLSTSARLLTPIAVDPTLRGIADAVSFSMRGVRGRRVSMDEVAGPLGGFSDAIEKELAGRRADFSWRGLLSGEAIPASQLRQFVEVDPILDFNDFEPGAQPTEAIRKAVEELKLADNGVTVRLTGPVRVSDEEFGTLKEGALTEGVVTVVAVLIILWLALHSGRIIGAVFFTLFVGLFATAAMGLILVGAFNPISVAFFVLFVGIGVDFGLQFSVGYRAERFENPDLTTALVSTAFNLGERLAIAALATAAGFLSFLPTAYSGLSELGLVAGAGMIIAFITSITVLPALLSLINPPAEPHPLGYAFLEPVDRYMERHRISILVLTLFFVIAALPLLSGLKFDFNPMNLRSSKVESVATFLDLRKDPETSGITAEVLKANLDDANAIAKKLSELPEVSRAMTLSSFVPEGQDRKLQILSETAAQIGPLINPGQTKPAPTDADTVASLETAATLLNQVSEGRQTASGETARRLSAALSKLAKADASVRQKVEKAFIDPFKITLNDLRLSMTAERITLANLPPDLKSDWQTEDGRSRVSVSPKGDAGDNAVLERFASAVLKVEPNAVGEPVSIQKAGDTIVNAFIQAAIFSLVSISILLWVTLKRFLDVVLTLFPLILAGIVTLQLCVVLGLKLNFANIIALPVLLGVGVAFKIYYIVAWREGQSGLLASSLTRAVFFSGMTTAVAFGSLWMSAHPGTSSMGKLLALSLVTTMAAAVLFQPLLMGPPRQEEEKKP